MKFRRFLRDAAVAALALAALQAFQAYLLQEALLRQERVSVRKLQIAVAGVLNHAHQSKDDLTIYHVMNALTKSPGIIEARIEEAEKSSRVPPDQRGYAYVLRDGSQKWGRLVLSMSDRSRRALIRRQWLMGTGAAGFLWILLFLYLQLLEKHTLSLQTQAIEWNGLLQSERKKLVQSQEREQRTALQATACLQKAIQCLPVPLMVLDAQQRISAVNNTALGRMQVSDPKEILGKSWHEVPALHDCGAVLEQSLVSPGKPVEWNGAASDSRLRFETDAEKLTGTWIFL